MAIYDSGASFAAGVAKAYTEAKELSERRFRSLKYCTWSFGLGLDLTKAINGQPWKYYLRAHFLFWDLEMGIGKQVYGIQGSETQEFGSPTKAEIQVAQDEVNERF